MISIPALADRKLSALRRLVRLGELDDDDMIALEATAELSRSASARRDMTGSLNNAGGAVLVLDGWAHRAHLLADGRRQITELLLPGDILSGSSLTGSPDASITAITTVSYCFLPATDLVERPGLGRLVDADRACREASLSRQVVRLGRLDAFERTADWLVELYDRLDAVGYCNGESMPLPLTQETMADALGLTSVHINRTLSVLRREGLVNVQGGCATFLDRDRCRSIVGRR